MKVAVLGAGLVGLPLALDLAGDKSLEITVSDLSPTRIKLARSLGLKGIQADLSQPDQLKKVLKGKDFVINAVPGFMGYDTLKRIIEEGKNVVDIAFCPEDFLELDDLAKKMGVTAIPDAGVAPGMSNILSAHAAKELEEVTTVKILVGGLPKVRMLPWQYKAVFSPIDVIEEYTRPARIVRNGKIIELPALTEAEDIDVPGLGTLEAFNSDGLRSLLKTINCPDMVEKTLRYPGYLEKIKLLKDTGFFDQEPVAVGGTVVRPVDLTAKLLFPQWELKPGDEDITVMIIEVTGKLKKKGKKITWTLVDEYDAIKGVHSMARTTGYTATAIARLVIEGKIKEKGVLVPEVLSKNEEWVKLILKYLAERKVIYKKEVIDD